MKYFCGKRKRSCYFEGWYLKHQNKDQMISFIPSLHIDENGARSACLQVITKEGSCLLNYKEDEFYADTKQFYVKIGNNIFSSHGIRIDIREEDLCIQGSLKYGYLKKLKSNIMGPYQYLPFLKCSHDILSMKHTLRGKLKVNEDIMDFTTGTGYIEKDLGCSFPNSYFWTQCILQEVERSSIMLSIAEVPLFGKRFTGVICAIIYGGVEYRMATYQGVEILRYTQDEIILRQDDYMLGVQVLDQSGFCLKAPVDGSLRRTVKESPICKVRYCFRNSERIIFDITSERASVEIEM